MRYQRHTMFLIKSFVVLAVVLTSHAIVFADDDPLGDTVEIERRVSHRFKLTSKELTSIRSLIRTDNRNVVRFYWSASDEQRSDYMSLWEKLRQARQDFEASIDPSFNNRQRSALKMAHTEFESRILYLWLDDYLDFLGSTLDLDSPQTDLVRRIFQTDQDRRHQALIETGSSPVLLEAKWDQLSKERDAQLNLVLDTDQRRVYRSLSESPAQLLA